MTALVVAIDEQQASEAARAERLDERMRQALRIGQSLTSGPAKDAIEDVFHFALGLVAFWKRRAARVENQLRDVLACDALTDEQRERFHADIERQRPRGERRQRWLRHQLEECEQQMIAQYRAMDPAGRYALRTLLGRINKGVGYAE